MIPFTVHPVRAKTNLIKNGDFSQDLDGWEKYVWQQVGEAPHIEVIEDSGNPCLYIDAPANSSAIVYQVFDFPNTSFAELRFRVCGGMDSVRVRVYIEDNPYPDQWSPIDEFDPAGKKSLGGVFTTKWYNVTEYAGTAFILAFWADSPNEEGTGACVYIDDVAVNIVTETSSIITCYVNQAPRTIGENLTVNGFIRPSLDGNVTLTYSRPNSSIVIRNVTAHKGDYKDVFVPDTPGIWSVFASWNGSDSYEGATSLPTPFIISHIWSLNITSNMVTINDVLVNLEDGIEAIPGEKLTGSITVTSSVARRPELDQLVVFNTWERDRWDLLLFYLGTVEDRYGEGIDPFGVKNVLAAPFRIFDLSLDTEKGAFVVEYGWQFPMLPDTGNDIYGDRLVLASDHPTFKAPIKNGTYYIIFYLSASRSAREAIYPPNKEFGVFPNQTVYSVWDVNSTYWENVTLEKRDVNYSWIFAVPVYVTEGVDEAISNATRAIGDAERNFIPIEFAKENLSIAISEYNSRRFSNAKKYAETAFNLANEKLLEKRDAVNQTLESVNNTLTDFAHFNFLFMPVAEVTSLNRTLQQSRTELELGNYFKAEQLLDQIQKDIDETVTTAWTIIIITFIIVVGASFYGVLEGIEKVPKVVKYLFRYLMLAVALGALWQLLLPGVFTLPFFALIIGLLLSSIIFAFMASVISRHFKKYLAKIPKPKEQV